MKQVIPRPGVIVGSESSMKWLRENVSSWGSCCIANIRMMVGMIRHGGMSSVRMPMIVMKSWVYWLRDRFIFPHKHRTMIAAGYNSPGVFRDINGLNRDCAFIIGSLDISSPLLLLGSPCIHRMMMVVHWVGGIIYFICHWGRGWLD